MTAVASKLWASITCQLAVVVVQGLMIWRTGALAWPRRTLPRSSITLTRSSSGAHHSFRQDSGDRGRLPLPTWCPKKTRVWMAACIGTIINIVAAVTIALSHCLHLMLAALFLNGHQPPASQLQKTSKRSGSASFSVYPCTSACPAVGVPSDQALFADALIQQLPWALSLSSLPGCRDSHGDCGLQNSQPGAVPGLFEDPESVCPRDHQPPGAACHGV